MIGAANQFIDQGNSLKQAGDLEGAKIKFFKALEFDPLNRSAYMSLGKTAYLLKNQNLALKCYLASMHLQLSPIEKDIQNDQLSCHLKIQHDTFPSYFLTSLPRKSAFVLYLYPNTPRHAAHTLIDLSPIQLRENPYLKPYAEIYQSFISKNGTHSLVLNKHHKTTDDQLACDQSYYIPYGRNYFLKELQWGKILNNDVQNLYF